MATNEILKFAGTDTGENLLSQSEYLADTQRSIGNQPGRARANLVNKALRQASLMAAGVAEFIAENQGDDVTDDLTPQNIADYLSLAIADAHKIVGIIIAYGAGTAPDGYLRCDGATISRTTYADLFAVIGITYGVGDGSTTFRIPDLRGEFLRGADLGRGADPDVAGRSGSGGVSSTQADELRSHTHLSGTLRNDVVTGGGGSSQAFNSPNFVATSASGGNETRPRNVAVLYCIRY